MKLVGLMLVRNARWIIGASSRAALTYCDEVVILDHASDDRTCDIVAQVAAAYPGRVTLLRETTPDFNEMNFRERLLQTAREHGATHVANIDDDEIMTTPMACVIRDHVERLPAGHSLAMHAPRIWGGLDTVQLPSAHYSEPVADVVFGIDASTSYQPGPDGYQFHSRRPRGITKSKALGPELGGQMHLQTVSLRRFLAKQAWYKMIELLRWPQQGAAKINARYDETVYKAQTEFRIAMVPPEWWEGQEAVRKAIDLEAEPWQEAEARRLYAEHGAARFAALDLYGVCR